LGVAVTQSATRGRTLYDKIVASHTIRALDDHHVLLYVDRHILNEYTSPQAFAGLRASGRTVRHPDSTLGIVDHVNPTSPVRTGVIADPEAARQVAFFERNCRDFGIELFGLTDPRQGLEHVVVPEQGIVCPGMVIACGDSHTTTYGAYGALGFGIGTSDVEHVLATQTLVYQRLQNYRVTVTGALAPGVSGKDLVMSVIRRIGVAGATGFAVEFAGPAVAALDIAGRMTICNMIVESGARGALIAPDATVLSFLKHRPRAPRESLWEKAVKAWGDLRSDDDAVFQSELMLDARSIEPVVTWGTSPDQAVSICDRVPDPELEATAARRAASGRALDYMGLTAGTPMQAVKIDRAFIGSCTNGRLEDLRAAANILAGRKVASHVRAMVVPGSSQVRREAEREGLDRIFLDAGFEWRQSGCSMCLGMNDDILEPGERCASSTNRNFEGRQGRAGRTHLMSPAMVAAAAVAGHLADVRDYLQD